MGNWQLEVSDIWDLREYERIREDYRKKIIELKKLRRVSIGPFISVVFENKETVRFQIQELARAEKILDDSLIKKELEIYNVLLPGPGILGITLLIELTTKQDLQTYLPKLVGIENHFKMIVKSPHGSKEFYAECEKEHGETLSRSDITSSVHYLILEIPAGLRSSFKNSEVDIEIDHPEYKHIARLSEATIKDLSYEVEGIER
jgi:aspartyl/asparaginyl-tRNA synthetase